MSDAKKGYGSVAGGDGPSAGPRPRLGRQRTKSIEGYYVIGVARISACFAINRATARSHGPCRRVSVRKRACMGSSPAPIPFARSMLRQHRHVCAFFNSANDEYGTLLPFICEGISCGHRAFHVLPSKHRREHLDRLTPRASTWRRRRRAGSSKSQPQRTPTRAAAGSTRKPCSLSSRRFSGQESRSAFR